MTIPEADIGKAMQPGERLDLAGASHVLIDAPCSCAVTLLSETGDSEYSRAPERYQRLVQPTWSNGYKIDLTKLDLSAGERLAILVHGEAASDGRALLTVSEPRRHFGMKQAASGALVVATLYERGGTYRLKCDGIQIVQGPEARRLTQGA